MQNVVALFSMHCPKNIYYVGNLNCQLFIDCKGQLRIKNPDNYLRYLEYYHVHKNNNEIFLAFDIHNQRFHRINWILPEGFKSLRDVFNRTGLIDKTVVIQRKKSIIFDVDLKENWGFNLDICPGEEIRSYILSALAILNQKTLYNAVSTYNPNKVLISNYKLPKPINYDIPSNITDLWDSFLAKIEDYIFNSYGVEFDVYGANLHSINYGNVLGFFLDNLLQIDDDFEDNNSFVCIYHVLQWRLKNPKNNHACNGLFLQSELDQIYNIIINGNNYFKQREYLFKKIKIYHNPSKNKFGLNNSYYDYLMDFLQNSTTIKNFQRISKHLRNSKNTLLFLGDSHIYQMNYFQMFLYNWKKNNPVQFKLMVRNLENLQKFIVNNKFFYPNYQELIATIDFTLNVLNSI